MVGTVMNKIKKGNIIKRFAPLMVYGCWTIVFWWLLQDQRYTAYIQIRFWWLVLAGALATLVFFWSSVRTSVADDRTNPIKKINQTLLLFFPIFFIFSVEGKSLNSFAMHRRMVGAVGTISNQVSSQSTSKLLSEQTKYKQTPTPTYSSYQEQLGEQKEVLQQHKQTTSEKKGPVKCSLLDLTRHPTSYINKKVILRTMIYSGKEVPEGYTALFQFMLICCAADARPIAVLVDLDKVGSVDKEKWVETTGRFKMITLEGNSAYYIDVKTMKNVSEPPRYEQYLYY